MRAKHLVCATALMVSWLARSTAQDEPPASPKHYTVSIRDCPEPVCTAPPIKADDIEQMVNQICTQTEKSRKLLEGLLPRGRKGLEESLSAAGVSRVVTNDLNGSRGDTWNAVTILDILTKTSHRCEKGVYIECESSCEKYQTAWSRPRTGWTVHLCTNAWCKTPKATACNSP